MRKKLAGERIGDEMGNEKVEQERETWVVERKEEV